MRDFRILAHAPFCSQTKAEMKVLLPSHEKNRTDKGDPRESAILLSALSNPFVLAL
jgi:hypothetical protein